MPLERRYLAFLAEVGTILGEPLPYDATLQRICEAAVRTVADVSTMYLFDAAGELQFVGGAHTVADRSERLRRRALALMRDPKGPRWWFESVIRKGSSLLIPRVDEATIGFAGGSRQFVEFIQEIGVRSFLIVPMLEQGEVIGAFALVYADSGLHYDNEALVLAEDLGRRVGAALGKAKLHETAMNVSAAFQLAALPKSLPNVHGCAIDSLYEPGTVDMMVGGDWFDAFELPGQRLGISVGDVSGHGVEAAAFMGTVRSGLHIAMLLDADLLKVLAAADVLLRQESNETMYATAAIAILDARQRTMSCALAGHPGPLHWSERTQNVSDPFVDRGLPLGARNLADSQGEAHTIELEDGDFFAFFTDGLLEGKRDYEAGQTRLHQAVANRWIRQADHPARAIRDAVAPERHEDDVVILTLRF
ncbi:MAG: SpoIIE family protein phosphatase [Candidatus Eremiobacteraeota bacterium]|nr:SpoIIE family protein phosphatase [Candidatus Eremiobacteraeota bacterium]